MIIRDLGLDDWADLLPATGFEAFHTPEALSVVNEYAKGDLRLVGGFRGREPVGLFPVFVRERWSLTFVLSPPPGLSVPHLGPVLMSTGPKRRKQETVNKRFTDAILETVGVNSPRTLFGTVGTSEYVDPRPYRWRGFDVDTRFNYELDFTDRDDDEVIESFTRSLRREIRKGDGLDVSIETGGPSEAERVCGDVKERHAEQGITYPTPRAYAGDIVDALGDRARVYVARGPDDQYLGGITVLYSNDGARFWQGGARASYENVSVNSLLHWAIIEDILSDPALEGVERYDLGSADNRRISRYKSKFNPELIPYYEIKSDMMAFAKKAYSIRRHLTAENLRALSIWSLTGSKFSGNDSGKRTD